MTPAVDASAETPLPAEGRQVVRRRPPDSELRARLRAMQLQAAERFAPWIAAAHALGTGTICFMFLDSAPAWALLGWAALVMLAACGGLPAWQANRRSRRPRHATRNDVARTSSLALVLAALWAVPLPLLATDAALPQMLALAAVVAVLTGLHGLALATLRQAGMIYPAIVGVGAAAMLATADPALAGPLAALLVAQAIIVALGVHSSAATFKGRVVAELRAEQQHQVIGLLLRDFEQQAADVLWEADAQGRLRHVSNRLARMLGRSSRALDGRSLVELLQRRQRTLEDDLIADATQSLVKLQEHFDNARAFRDIEVPVRLGQRTQWWSLTAKPVGDGSLWRGVAANVTATREAQRHVWQLAHFDGITGLSNRHHFRVALDEVLKGVRSDGGVCAVLCLDLDGFKTVNDALGHDMGDALLRVVGQRLEAVRRKGDIVARLGGDEFGIIVRDIADADEAALVAGRVLYALARPCEIGGVTVPVAASLGVALAPSDGCEPELLLKHADLALYAAKGAGRGQFSFYTPSMGAKVMKRLQIERALREAIPGGQLRVLYQPQLDLATGQISGCEALLRWSHPELGDVGPNEFIPVAEEAGMITDIGRWVLHEACIAAKGWPESVRVCVNLSPLQVVARDLRADVAHALATSSLPARRLEIEITESVLLGDNPATFAKLHAVREMGVRIALDDFGTGYASLAYLRSFPFDQLKIDQTFVREIAGRHDARAIVRATIEMARGLKMDSLAEGVEDDETLELLRGQGCGTVQGYRISPPLPAHEMLEFLARWFGRRVVND